MFTLNLPSADLKIIKRGTKPCIFDVLRRRYITLTPEEWVRQHFVHFLLHHLGYPKALLANEVSLSLNGTAKRCDSVLYDRTGTPRMIIEYKAPHIPITQNVFEQISRYNLVLRVDYLVVTNGLNHYCCRMDYERQTCTFLPKVPAYTEL